MHIRQPADSQHTESFSPVNPSADIAVPTTGTASKALSENCEIGKHTINELYAEVSKARELVKHYQKWLIMYRVSLTINALVEAVENAMKKAIEGSLQEQEALEKEITQLKEAIATFKKQIGELQADIKTLKNGNYKEKREILNKYGMEGHFKSRFWTRIPCIHFRSHSLTLKLVKKVESLVETIKEYSKQVDNKEEQKKKILMELVNGTLMQFIALLMLIPQMLDQLMEQAGGGQAQAELKQEEKNTEEILETLEALSPEVAAEFRHLEESRIASQDEAIESFFAGLLHDDVDCTRLETAVARHERRQEEIFTQQAHLLEHHKAIE